MAKIYWESPFHTVSKSFFGPWTILDRRTGIANGVTPQISDRFSDVVRLARKAGYDTKRDPAAIGMVFTWLIAVSCYDAFDAEEAETAGEIMFANDQNTLNLLRNIYDNLKNLG